MVDYKFSFFVTLGILILSLILFVFIILGLSTQKSESLDERALVVAITDMWGENVYNSSEALLDGKVFNYGDAEAQNVIVTCEMYDSDKGGNMISEIPIFSVSENIGNVASRSFKDFQLVHNIDGTNDYSQSFCFIESCEKCENLDNRIL